MSEIASPHLKAIAENLAADLAPGPDRYTNAVAHAVRILADTSLTRPGPEINIYGTAEDGSYFERTHVSQPCLPDAQDVYDYTSALSGMLSGTPADRVKEFGSALTADELLRQRRAWGGDERIQYWQRPPEATAEFVGRTLAFTDTAQAARGEVQGLFATAASMTPAMLMGVSNRLLQANERLGLLADTVQFPVAESVYEVGDDAYPMVTDTTRLRDGIRSLQNLGGCTARAAELREKILTIVDAPDFPDISIHSLGAKGANLLKMNYVLEGLRTQGDSLAEVISIPPFMVVETDAYRAWRGTGAVPIDTTQAVKTWMDTQAPSAAFIARSSAVHSEDGEHMGAGVYDSVTLPVPATSEDIENALVAVYGSVGSQQAAAYRQEIGVDGDDEAMAVVVQQYVESGPRTSTYPVTVNSMMPHQPRLAEYISHRPADDYNIVGDRRLPLDRNGLVLEFGSGKFGGPEALRFHVPPDLNTHRTEHVWAAGQAAVFSEAVLGRPVQIEAVLEEEECQQAVVRLVQARPLPETMLTPINFGGFPNATPWYAGKGVGVMNGVRAQVRPGRTLNYSSELNPDPAEATLLRFNSSFAGSRTAYDVAELLLTVPEEQRARTIMFVRLPPEVGYGSGHGHFETMAAELGINLVFYDQDTQYHEDLVDGQLVTVYSDGFHAKIYSDTKDPSFVSQEKAEAEYQRRLDEELWGSGEDFIIHPPKN